MSMIDMMTILVFFLLMHGGFVRLAILELNLPRRNRSPSDEPPEFQLEITVREIRHRGRRPHDGAAEPHRQDRTRLRPRRADGLSHAGQAAVPRQGGRDVAARARHLRTKCSWPSWIACASPSARRDDRRRPARQDRAVPRNLDRRCAGAELEGAAMKFMGRAARMAAASQAAQGRGRHQPRVDDRHAHDSRVLPARVLDAKKSRCCRAPRTSSCRSRWPSRRRATPSS